MLKKKNNFLVVANWKANPSSLKLAKNIFNQIKKVASKIKKTKVVVCPSYLHLIPLSDSLGRVSLGAQDTFYEENGSFTGMVGYEMLFNTKIKYVLVGHSERRTLGDDENIVAKKMLISSLNGIIPILCVGEKERDNSLNYLEVIKNQLISAFKDFPKSKVKDVIVAYEPVWSIGKNAVRVATKSEIQEMIIFIKRVIGDIYQTKSIPPIKILYGGSVNEKNINELLEDNYLDGFLVGRASLDSKVFTEILKKVDSF